MLYVFDVAWYADFASVGRVKLGLGENWCHLLLFTSYNTSYLASVDEKTFTDSKYSIWSKSN